MALFSKPPAKKTLPPRQKVAEVPSSTRASAREVAAKAGALGKDRRPKLEPVPADESITGASLIEWSPQPQAIEVAQANPGLCAVLENAALMYASGQAAAARSLLEQGVAGDHDTKQSPLAWLALFDLLQRAGDRAAYDQLAIQYSVQFERSAPGWEGREAASGPKGGGYVVLTGQLTGDSAAQLEGLRRAVQKRVTNARLDLSAIGSFDDAGARLLGEALAEARKAELQLSIERMDKLWASLESAVRSGRDGGEGAWLLSLELLQWKHDQATFDDRAIEYALAFEVSPPSWEPPPLAMAPLEAPGPADAAQRSPEVDALALSGVLAGNASSHASKLVDFAHGRQIVAVDLAGVERVDFVCAGALLNAINRIEGARKSVQIHGVSPIIRALLLLIGLSPRHFVKKAA